MWIFGYGSLMFDGWEAFCGCIDRKWADLPGYRRSFNKKSVESRGTREVPGLTLNLVRAAGLKGYLEGTCSFESCFHPTAFPNLTG